MFKEIFTEKKERQITEAKEIIEKQEKMKKKTKQLYKHILNLIIFTKYITIKVIKNC